MTTTDDDGFTLVEMLITLAIVGVVFGLFSSVIGFGRDIFARTAAGGAYVDEFALTKRLLIDTLSQVVIMEKGSFSGEQGRLVAVAYGPRALGLAGPTATTYEPGEDGRGLRVTWAEGSQGKAVTRRILSGETELSFSYFGADRGWVVGWNLPDILPDLIRIQLRRGSDVISTEFTIPVRYLSSPLCLPAPASRCVSSR